MKKTRLLAMGLACVLLTGCSFTNPFAKNQGTTDLSVENVGDDNGGSVATDGADQSSSSNEANSDETALLAPVYKTVGRYDYRYSEDDSYVNLTQAEYTWVLVTEDSKDAFPGLYDALMNRAKDAIEEFGTQCESDYECATEQYNSMKENWDEFEFPTYINNLVDYISRADSKLVSICSSYESYDGGAHGYYGTYGDSYLVDTGEKISLSNVFTISEDEFVTKLKDKLKVEFDERESSFDYIDDYLCHYKFSPDPAKDINNGADDYEMGYTFYFDFNGVHIVFNPYEIADYASGAFDVCFGYDEGVISDEYLLCTDQGYINHEILPVCGADYEYKNEIEGMHFEIPYEDEEMTYASSITLVSGDKSASVEADIYADDFQGSCYHIYTKDGREYIYVIFNEFNDYTDLVVFDITGGNISAVGSEWFHGIYMDSDDIDFCGDPCLTDPDNMILGRVGEALGSFQYYNEYRVGDDGMPVAKDEVCSFAMVCTSDIVAKLDVPAYKVVDGVATEESSSIPAGAKVVPVATDGKSYIDVQLEDGSVVRIYYVSFEYPASIDGVSIDDYFADLIYVG